MFMHYECAHENVTCAHVMQVDTVSSHASASPPPADKECPLKPHMQETDRLLLTGAVVEMEYTYKVCISSHSELLALYLGGGNSAHLFCVISLPALESCEVYKN